MEKLFVQNAILKSLVAYGPQTQNMLYESVIQFGSCTNKTYRSHLKQLVDGGQVVENKKGKQMLEYSLVDATREDEVLQILDGVKKGQAKSTRFLHNELKPFKNLENFEKVTPMRKAILFEGCYQSLLLLIEMTKYYSIFNSTIWGGPKVIRLCKEIQKKQQDEIDKILREIREIDPKFFAEVTHSVLMYYGNEIPLQNPNQWGGGSLRARRQ